MRHALAEQRFRSYEDIKKCLDECYVAKGEGFYWRGVHKLRNGGNLFITIDGAFFE